jgi:hypothetical protein
MELDSRSGVRRRGAPAGLAAASLILAATTAAAEQTVGLFLNDEASFDGYTLFAPHFSSLTYLIDNEGKQVHSWFSPHLAVGAAYLLEDGSLIRVEQVDDVTGGRVERFAWDGTLLWNVVYADEEHTQHHDVEPLPNGNVLMITWETRSELEAIAAGMNPAEIGSTVLALHVIEVEPDGLTGGNIVWQWRVWDHLVQDFDPTKANFGVVADHPGRMDANYAWLDLGADWLHTNSIDYNEELDQILLSLGWISEIWVLDHGTTTAEAAGESGGRSGMGGAILYRWGNPAAYDRGGPGDQKLYLPHDARWIEAGLPGAGNITIFNNGLGHPEGPHSTVEEIVPPIDENGHYPPPGAGPYGPEEPVWRYVADPPESFYAQNRSGAHRLPNGNTLLCHGPEGIFFEVTPAGETVWLYVSPVQGAGGPVDQGQPGGYPVFRNHRYAPDYPAFEGKELTPGDPVELFDPPRPVPAGYGLADPMTCGKSGAAGTIRVFWDLTFCHSTNYDLLYGALGDVATYTLLGAKCGIGGSGSYNWTGVPSGDLFFLVVGVDECSVYESSWGVDSSGQERNGTAPSQLCGVTTKLPDKTCR